MLEIRCEDDVDKIKMRTLQIEMKESPHRYRATACGVDRKNVSINFRR
jgi:hypothetical protein